MILFIACLLATGIVGTLVFTMIYRPGHQVPVVLPIAFLKYLITADSTLDYSFYFFPSHFASKSLQRKAGIGYRECRVRQLRETMVVLTYGELWVAQNRARWASYYTNWYGPNPVPDLLFEALIEVRPEN